MNQISILKQITRNFTSELENARSGAKSSIPYILHTLPSEPLVKVGEVFQVLVVGGTVFRSVLCKETEGKIVVLRKQRSQPPVFHTGEDFLQFIISHIDSAVSTVSLNFAYPLQPVFNGHLDGKLLSGSKENDFSGLIGTQIGHVISDLLQKEQNRKVRVTCANDAICLLLSGLSKYDADSLFGGIVGTGVNFAIFEDSVHPVNLESANFNTFALSEEAKKIDANSVRPGDAVFEKEVSGKYLYQHYNIQVSGQINLPLHSTSELEELSHGMSEESERAKKIFDHSASLVACQIAGIVEYKQKDMICVMEGSLFWKADNYKTLVETYIPMLTSYHVQFVKIDSDSIIGAAMLASR